MDIEISLSGPETEHVDRQIRSGRAGSEGEVLREALQFRMEHECELDDGQESEQWREAARRSIRNGP